MWGIEEKDLEPIRSIAEKFDPYPVYNPDKLGAWGILFLCCGAMAAGNDLWRDRIINSEIYIPQTQLKSFIMGSDVCTSDEYASKFAKLIREWNNNDYAIAEAGRRMEKYRGQISDKVFLFRKTYLTLAHMLNSFEETSKDQLLGFDCQTWVNISSGKKLNYGWPELFFAAGILLKNEESVDWRKMASIIHGMGKSVNVDVAPLFEHYAGRKLFSPPPDAKIQATQLKKGMRILLRSGWEAIVIKSCDENILTAKVFGDFTETGSIYAHDVVAAKVDGKWVDVEMTEEQFRFQTEIGPFFSEKE